jgi:hypothetical protein
MFKQEVKTALASLSPKTFSHRCPENMPGGGDCNQDRTSFECRRATCRTCVDLDYELFPLLSEGEIGSDFGKSSHAGCKRLILTIMSFLEKSANKSCPKCTLILEGIKKSDNVPSPSSDLKRFVSLDNVTIILYFGGIAHVQKLGLFLEFYSHASLCTNSLQNGHC